MTTFSGIRFDDAEMHRLIKVYRRSKLWMKDVIGVDRNAARIKMLRKLRKPEVKSTEKLQIVIQKLRNYYFRCRNRFLCGFPVRWVYFALLDAFLGVSKADRSTDDSIDLTENLKHTSNFSIVTTGGGESEQLVSFLDYLGCFLHGTPPSEYQQKLEMELLGWVASNVLNPFK